MSDTGGPIILDPIIVVGTPNPPGLPSGSWWGDQGGWGSQGDYYDPTYGGGSGYDPGTPDEPCATGLSVIDNPETQYGFDRLWSQSGFEKPMAERREQGAWLIQHADGTVGWQEFPSTWVRTPCGIDAPSTFVIPEGTIAMVHTHPYSRGELLAQCEKQELPGGMSLYTNYSGNSSIADDDFIKSIRETVAPNLVGIVIDNDEILGYDGSGGEPQRIPRCGY